LQAKQQCMRQRAQDVQMGVFEQGVAVGARANIVLEHLLVDAEMRVGVEVVVVLVFLCVTSTCVPHQYVHHLTGSVVLVFLRIT